MLSWDGYALSLSTPRSKYHLYLIPCGSGSSSETLFRSQTYVHGWFGRTLKQNSLFTTKSSYLAALVCPVRDFIYDFGSIPLTDLANPALPTVTKISLIALLLICSYIAPINLLVEMSLMTLCRRMIMKNRITKDFGGYTYYYPLKEMLNGLALGTLAAFPMMKAVQLFMLGTNRLMDHCAAPQEVIRHMSDPRFGVINTLTVCLCAPLIEERFFRGYLRDCEMTLPHKTQKGMTHRFKTIISPYMHRQEKTPSLTVWTRLKTVAKISLVFGMAHFSSPQGSANLAIVGATTLIGLTCGGLTELTGNLWAGTIVHALNNTYVALRCHNIIDPFFGLP